MILQESYHNEKLENAARCVRKGKKKTGIKD